MKKNAGFSIIELLVVMAIMMILTTIGMPMMGDWIAEQRLKDASRSLFSAMQLTKLEAIKNNKEWAIVFDEAGKRYLICSDPGPDTSWSDMSDNTIEKIVKISDYKSGVGYGHGSSGRGDNITYLNNIVVFTPTGTTDRLGYVYLTNNIGTAYRIGSPTFGVIAVKKWADGWK